MADITWEDAFCGEGNNCYRIGVDGDGNSYIAVAGAEASYLTDTTDALRQLILDIKAGKADHLLDE
ncbi:hypothetical protein [Streptomyces sp. NBC_00091]|uniref:hypothetical protein n=1 Tax=Streptomyces sp. NBC_00091 TaxID=2975648 RepID=UPI00224CDD83|nr:hypothetical protein [Streptomyces sp. NBC_00091]MCX5376220.1 hypothetical protein [Streptomyces sp. NBC_00091]